VDFNVRKFHGTPQLIRKIPWQFHVTFGHRYAEHFANMERREKEGSSDMDDDGWDPMEDVGGLQGAQKREEEARKSREEEKVRLERESLQRLTEACVEDEVVNLRDAYGGPREMKLLSGSIPKLVLKKLLISKAFLNLK
jgi:hypothetical protein